MSLIDPDVVGCCVESGWWGTRSLHRVVRAHAAAIPESDAFVTSESRNSWATYDSVEDDLAGARAGGREIAHLVRKTGARALVTLDGFRERSSSVLVRELRDHGPMLDFDVVMSERGVERIADVAGRTAVPVTPVRADRGDVDRRSLGPNDLSLLNSSSGTTGLPKCVTQFDNRWTALSYSATEFEERAGAKVRQFFGSNESGAFGITVSKESLPEDLVVGEDPSPSSGSKVAAGDIRALALESVVVATARASAS